MQSPSWPSTPCECISRTLRSSSRTPSSVTPSCVGSIGCGILQECQQAISSTVGQQLRSHDPRRARRGLRAQLVWRQVGAAKLEVLKSTTVRDDEVAQLVRRSERAEQREVAQRRQLPVRHEREQRRASLVRGHREHQRLHQRQPRRGLILVRGMPKLKQRHVELEHLQRRRHEAEHLDRRADPCALAVVRDADAAQPGRVGSQHDVPVRGVVADVDVRAGAVEQHGEAGAGLQDAPHVQRARLHRARARRLAVDVQPPNPRAEGGARVECLGEPARLRALVQPDVAVQLGQRERAQPLGRERDAELRALARGVERDHQRRGEVRRVPLREQRAVQRVRVERARQRGRVREDDQP